MNVVNTDNKKIAVTRSKAMTIFLMVLKKLIKTQLGPLSISLGKKADSTGYNNDLSRDQQEIIDTLDNTLSLLQGTGNDANDTATVIELIDTARKKIQTVRELYKEPRDGGETMKCINSLKSHTSDFYEKLLLFKFCLLNKPYFETPENIIYYHATYYFGEEIFAPKAGLDVDIRNKKERKLEMRLKFLSELIDPSYNLEEQRERSLQVLDDLFSDNNLAIKKDDGNSAIPMPGLSFWGMSVTLTGITEIFAASEGRMAVQFNQAARKIKAMTNETFQPPVVPESVSHSL